MRELNQQKVFVQYRDNIKPYDPVMGRKYTITHSDTTAELFVFIAQNYADDKVTKMRDEVRMAWDQTEMGLALIGYVIIDAIGVIGDPQIRFKIFYSEMPIALQALRQADRFLFDANPFLDNLPIYIRFVSSNAAYNMTFDFGTIGYYKQ